MNYRPRIVLIGKNSFVGGMLVDRFKKDGYYVDALTSNECDVRDSMQVERLIKYKPDVVISSFCVKGIVNCAQNKAESYRVNSVGAFEVSQFCSRNNIKHVYLSTDNVYAGNFQDFKYGYADKPQPRTTFGSSKHFGEQFVQLLSGTVIRTSRVYGYAPGSLFTMIVDSLRNGEKLELYDNLYDCPTFIGDLYESIKIVIENDILGVFNVVGKTYLSRYWFGRYVARVFRFDCGIFSSKKWNMEDEIRACGESYPQYLNVHSSDILRSRFGFVSMDIINGLTSLKKEMDNK